MTKILFLDDDQLVLDGFRRMLRYLQPGWDLTFHMSGIDALKDLETVPFDLLVTDLRMPAMDGFTFLARAHEIRPDAPKIVLSAFLSTANIYKAARYAQRFLSKPTKLDMLTSTINRLLAVREETKPLSVANILCGSGILKTSTITIKSVLERENGDNSESKFLEEVLARDPVWIAEALRLGLFTHGSPVADSAVLYDMLLRLGSQGLKSLAKAKIPGTFSAIDDQALGVTALAQHSCATGLLAAEWAEKRTGGPSLAWKTRLAGLLHDLGRFVLMSYSPDKYCKVIALHRDQGMSLPVAETAIFETTHQFIGAQVLALWGLPEEIVIAVRDHHLDPGNWQSQAGDAALIREAVYHANRDEHGNTGQASGGKS